MTCALVAGLGGWFAVARWDQADRVAAIVSALGAVAAVGVAVWAAVRAPQGASVRVSRTGDATAHGGQANTGVSGEARHLAGPVVAEKTGDAAASGDGDANTGIRLN
ncbi:hypothetical protein ACTG9Q_22605 [Actinokineospora sp. 24-640]